jgi:hypothetical protein
MKQYKRRTKTISVSHSPMNQQEKLLGIPGVLVQQHKHGTIMKIIHRSHLYLGVGEYNSKNTE